MIIDLTISNIIVQPELNSAQIVITPTFSSGGGGVGGGHIIQSETETLAQQPKLKFLGATVTNVGDATVVDGLKGDTGAAGANGEDGRGITSITLISTVGLIKTYRILYTDSTTFDYEVADGANGLNGKTAYQSALDGGYVGSELQFNTDLKDVSTKEFFKSPSMVFGTPMTLMAILFFNMY